jgi:hypothetical protein
MNGLLTLALLALAPQDFKTDLKAAYEKTKPLLERGRTLILEGKLDEAEGALLELFPEAGRTPVQAYLLGNLLWPSNPKMSYALHQRAAEKFPEEPDVQLEWAMEQHRAGDYAGAADAYAKYSAAVPEYAVAWGLAADCLIRAGRDRDAVKAWKASEDAKKGSLELFESMVCEIHRESIPLRLRADHLKGVAKGELDAAVALIALDGFYPGDWWNNRANKEFLSRDLVVVRKQKFGESRRMEAIECVAALAPAKSDETSTVRDALTKFRFLTDPDVTIPSDPKLAAIIIDHAVESNALGDRRKAVFDKVLTVARSTKNGDLWNAALFLYDGRDLLPLEKEAWEASGDLRFAIGYLTLTSQMGTLKTDDEILVQARKSFPESSRVIRHAYDLAKRDKKVTAGLLAEAIKAEYHLFSSTGVVPRPRAALLRLYFKELAALQE